MPFQEVSPVDPNPNSGAVRAAWSVSAPVMGVWETVPAIDFPNYAANSWGPEAAEALIARDRRSWAAIALT